MQCRSFGNQAILSQTDTLIHPGTHNSGFTIYLPTLLQEHNIDVQGGYKDQESYSDKKVKVTISLTWGSLLKNVYEIWSTSISLMVL